MHFIRKNFLTVLMMIFALTSCATQNSNPIMPDHFDLPNLFYSVKTNGSSVLSIQYIDAKNELQKIGIPLREGIQVFEFKFDSPGNVHFISASVPVSDSTHTLLFVTANGFTKNGKNFVEISYAGHLISNF